MIVVSPHLDDGAYSVGRILAGNAATLVTVTCGVPPVVLSAYDRSCGWSSSEDAVNGRIAEDRRAAAVLDVATIHLPILDGQYQPIDQAEVVARLTETFATAPSGPLLIPLGLGHPDHRIVSSAALHAAGNRETWLYEELPYRVVDPDDVAARIEFLKRAGTKIGAAVPGPWAVADLDVKAAAVACYRSQKIEEWHSLFAPERVHPVKR